ncbi:carbonic anhydrase/acetyltransferase-like protein (isoleucine patch superfamily) [Sphingomonas vulcanisoli]|uniref:Carbonic anhydrase/acetyltransferase-like protein (Isoleucine patch superfamily) n=1 Tax=Sphingomonas vulcanisoli TaxID=1658060 RepID=A0ABX0TRB8_9SPHN|nr:gamma carbonic anhydrase family protein [Sphingomonas vulcanisoli]NIJ08077.1 carbonic anhydrase/acetyltransferase-like protein (isoleucine patch superfamily) [Sphingomonas vulcanisoli]
MPCYEIDGKRPTLPANGDVWIAPSAELIGDARIGEGAGVWFHVMIRADNTPIIIGPDTNIQDGSILHSDAGSPLTVGRGATIGHNVILHGCTIGDHVMIGMGSTIMNGAVIGAESVVGANALVTEGKSFPPRGMILGAPAKRVRDLTDEEVAFLHQTAANYAQHGRDYAAGLRRID